MPVYLEQTGRAAGGGVRVPRREFSEKERRATIRGTYGMLNLTRYVLPFAGNGSQLNIMRGSTPPRSPKLNRWSHGSGVSLRSNISEVRILPGSEGSCYASGGSDHPHPRRNAGVLYFKLFSGCTTFWCNPIFTLFSERRNRVQSLKLTHYAEQRHYPHYESSP